MPCTYDDVPGSRSTETKLREELDLATRLLCGLMTEIEQAGPQEINPSQETWSWWRDHQERDLRRKIAEKEAKESERREVKRQIKKWQEKLSKLK